MASKDRRDLFPGALEMMILHTLQQRPLHGYAIAQAIQQASGDLLQIEEGTLYPALQRILREDWVHAEWGLSSRNRKVRIYRITASGRRQLDRERTFYERMNLGIGRVMRLQES